jgi:aminopeptidase N
MSATYRSLQLSEAKHRFDLLRVTSYDVTLDLGASETTFPSRTVIGFESGNGSTFVDVKPVTLHSVTLDGTPLDVAALDRGRLSLDLAAGSHELVVEATMPFRNDGEGLHRSVDAADGRAYVYGMCFLDAAPTIFACFDQPDLKAPYTLHVTTPTDWTLRGNAAATEVDPGRWELAPTRPLSTYFVSIIGGPYHVLEQEHDGIPLGLSSRRSLAGHLDEQADELFTVTRQCFDAFHRMFGVRYPFGAYHQAFLPEFNAGAMENPGLVTFRDTLVFTSRATRRQHISRAVVVAHEMAHQWFGNLVTLAWWDDLWLNESFAEYMGYRVTAEATEFTDAPVESANVRKIWGLVADGRPSTHPVAGTGAVDAAAALQDFDGISYAKGSAALAQLASLVGDEVFLGGVRRHFDLHAFGNATMRDLFTAWEDAGAGDLTPWTSAWLRTSGMDEIRVDRDAGLVRRTPPAGQDVQRDHAIHLARWDGSRWTQERLAIEADETPVDLGQAPVILDPRGETWASIVLDPVTVSALPDLVAGMDDPLVRASMWNAVRMGVHHARLSPAAAAAVLTAGLRVEDQDSALSSLQSWSSTLVALCVDRESVARGLHEAFRDRLATADPESGLALAALRGVIATDSDVDELRRWLVDGIEDTLPLDLDLRWRLVRRLTQLGATDRSELDARLEEERRAESQVHHAWCAAALASDGAKAWAWRRFRGEDDVPNHELEATGLGFWQTGQDDLLAPYVDRFFAEIAGTVRVRQGWVLGEAARSFFPLSVLDRRAVDLAHATLADPDLDLTLRRNLVDETDELEHRIAARDLDVREASGG